MVVQRKEPAAICLAHIPPHQKQKPPMLEWTNLHVYPSACMRCEPAFQCRFGLVIRTVDPTGLVLSLEVIFSPLGLGTQCLAAPSVQQNICWCHQSTLQGWKMSCMRKSFWAWMSNLACSHLITGGSFEECEEHRDRYRARWYTR